MMIYTFRLLSNGLEGLIIAVYFGLLSHMSVFVLFVFCLAYSHPSHPKQLYVNCIVFLYSC